MKKKGKSDEDAPAEGEEGEAAAEEPAAEEEEEEGEMTPKTLFARVDALVESITY